MAGSGQAGGETATRLDATVRGLRAGAGASDAGARAAAPAGAALSPVPPRGHAAAADGACRPRAGRAWRDARRRSDRAKEERTLGRCPVPAPVPVAQAGPEGRPRCTRSGLREVGPVDKARQRHALSVEVIGDGESGHVGRRRSAQGIERTNDTVGDAVPPLRQAQGAVLPRRGEASGQPQAAPRPLLAVPSRAARFHPQSHALGQFRMLTACRRPRAPRS